MRRTIQELREERGESPAELAAVLGVSEHEVTEWELGRAEPSVERTLALAKHFGVRDDQINLEPQRPPTLGEHLRDALDG